MADAGDGFVMSALVTTRCPAPAVAAFIAAPDQLPTWLIDVRQLLVTDVGDPCWRGATFDVLFGSHRDEMSFVGQNLEVTPHRILRRYLARGMQTAAGAYVRDVDYTIRPGDGATSSITCDVTTVIAGMSAVAVRASRRIEDRALHASLRRLTAVLEGGTVGHTRRTIVPTPL